MRFQPRCWDGFVRLRSELLWGWQTGCCSSDHKGWFCVTLASCSGVLVMIIMNDVVCLTNDMTLSMIYVANIPSICVCFQSVEGLPWGHRWSENAPPETDGAQQVDLCWRVVPQPLQSKDGRDACSKSLNIMCCFEGSWTRCPCWGIFFTLPKSVNHKLCC